MADHPNTIERAQGMLDWLRALPPGMAHEEARAAIGAATMYLHETFGEVHASAITGAIVNTIAAGGEVAPVETPAFVLH